MKIVTKALYELRHPEKNVRRHTEKQLKEYVRSLEMFGQIKPLIIDEKGEIIVGNGLYDALQRMGKEHCECQVISGLTSAQKKKLMLADNRVYELGITDMDIFEQIIRELEGDVDVPGWETDLLEVINASVTEVDDMIGSYGIYDQPVVESVNRRQQEQGEDVVEERLQPPVSPVPQVSNIPTFPAGGADTEAPNPSQASEVQVQQRYIICPKCGERICL